MSTAYLDGTYLPISEAKISPMDRGFLFGDAIYEVIPSHGGQMVGFKQHIARLERGLAALEIPSPLTEPEWHSIAQRLLADQGNGDLGIYLQVSRGAHPKRSHGFPEHTLPTVFAYAFEIPAAPVPGSDTVKCYRVMTAADQRWERCHIKSTALLGNVLHFRESQRAGLDEIILYNERQEITEAAACNVFAVFGDTIVTPPLDSQKLPGITRLLVLDILRTEGTRPVEERNFTLAELKRADEVWLTSASKEIAPVVEIDGLPVGSGTPGPIWTEAQKLFLQHKYRY